MEEVLLPILLLLVTIILILTLKMMKKKKLEVNGGGGPPPLPPGPRKLPIIGNLHQLAFTSLLPHRRLRDLARQYGPLMHLQLGETTNVVVSSAELARELLKTHDLNFASRPSRVSADIILYEARDIVFAPYGEYWRQMRKICALELLSPRRVGSLRAVREAEVRELVGSIDHSASQWSRKMKSEPNPSAQPAPAVNLTPLLMSLSNRVVSRATIGTKLGKEEESEFFLVMQEIMKAFGGFTLSDVFPSSRLLGLIGGTERRLNELHREVDVMLQRFIDDHVARRSAEKGEEEEDQDLVDVLLNYTREHGDKSNELSFPLTDVEIKAVISDMFLAGTDTTAVLLEWAMVELMKNPDEMEKAQREVRRVFDKKGKLVDEASLDELNYLNLIVKETLRLHLPAPLLAPRATRETVVINGYQIPAKTTVIINAWAICRDPVHWEKPDEFMPERFLLGSINYKGNDFQLIPFGAGRRICPGMQFGTAIVHLALANLLYHFDWKLPNQTKPQDLDMSEIFGVTVARKSDLYLIPIPYSAP
ncbi:unnamed protein product [Linum tenue]|uniref:Cytochrome P450 n=1 Tax=Linum tenue TaxID=586396 RepID=A0AAV0QEX5_9ROSI|nr:unnamed protein product [Linum tenue]